MNIFKYKKIIQIFKYIYVGILNNIFNYIIFNLSNFYFNLPIYFAGFLGFISGSIVSYLLNSKFTFSTRRRSKIQLVFFLVIQLVLLNIYSLLILIFKYEISINTNFAWFFATVIISIINFLWQQKLFTLNI